MWRFMVALMIAAVVMLTAGKQVMATSAAFERFRFGFFEDPTSARDRLDTAALAELKGEERDRAEKMLLDYLPDARGVIGLGLLRSARAVPRLVQLFDAELLEKIAARSTPGGFWASDQLVYLAKALWQISPNPRWPAAMIDVLASGDDGTQRELAAQALYGICDPAAVQPLIRALDDDDSLVRYHAARGLLVIHGLPAEPDGMESMVYRIMSNKIARREGEQRDILAAIDGRSICAQ
jgi:HEAT repeats